MARTIDTIGQPPPSADGTPFVREGGMGIADGNPPLVLQNDRRRDDCHRPLLRVQWLTKAALKLPGHRADWYIARMSPVLSTLNDPMVRVR